MERDVERDVERDNGAGLEEGERVEKRVYSRNRGYLSNRAIIEGEEDEEEGERREINRDEDLEYLAMRLRMHKERLDRGDDLTLIMKWVMAVLFVPVFVLYVLTLAPLTVTSLILACGILYILRQMYKY